MKSTEVHVRTYVKTTIQIGYNIMPVKLKQIINKNINVCNKLMIEQGWFLIISVHFVEGCAIIESKS